MSGIEVIVAVGAKNEQEFDALAARAEAVGLRIAPMGRLYAAGVLSGRIDAEKIATLEALPGVRSVEKSRTYRLPPDDREPQ